MQARTQPKEVLHEKAASDCGKDNRVLHTEQLPEKGEVGLSCATRESNRVRLEDQEIGVSSIQRYPVISHGDTNRRADGSCGERLLPEQIESAAELQMTFF
jgi:hypothetical protein